MKPIDEQQRSRYFAELSIALRRLGLDTQPPENGLLPVTKGGALVCLVSGGGGTRYRPENMTTEAMKEAMEKASETAAVVKEYMSLMESAPFLKGVGFFYERMNSDVLLSQRKQGVSVRTGGAAGNAGAARLKSVRPL